MNEMVYVVDDELHIRQLLELGLCEHGFATRSFENGEAFFSAVQQKLPDVVVLDWMMAPPDGMEICRQLRAQSRTQAIPIILLTARTEEVDRVFGLEGGADDYVSKPFSLKELAARIHALLRRRTYFEERRGLYIVCGDIEMDETARKVFIGERQVPLTMREYDLLRAFMKNVGRVLTREMLLDTVWGMEFDGDTRTVDVHIRYLRQKLGGGAGVEIQTVRGVGYRMEPPGS